MNADGPALGLQVRGAVKRRARPAGLRALWTPVRDQAPALAALLLSLGALLGGFNSLLGQAVAYIVNAALLIFLLVVYRPAGRFWRRVMPVLLLCAAAAGWVWLVNQGVRMIPGAGPPVAFARDLFGPEMLGFLAGVLALTCGALIGRHPDAASRFLRWLLLFNAAWVLWGLALRASDMDMAFDLWTVTRQGRFTGTIGNANVTAALAGAMAILAAGMVFGYLQPGRRRRPVAALLAGAGFFLFVGAMIATASRFAALVAVVLLLVLGTGVIGSRARNRIRAATLRRIVLALAAAGVVLLAAAGAILMDRFSSAGGDLGDRFTMWRHYAELAGKAPFYGYGLGAFPSLNAHFLSNIEMAQSVWNVNSAHNIMLQLLLNGGFPYFGLLALAFLYVGAAMLTGLRNEGWPPGRLAALLALVQIFCCALVDICLNVPALAILFLAMAGVLWGGRAIGRREPALLTGPAAPADQGRLYKF